MAAIVKPRRSNPSYESIVSGSAIRTGTWMPCADLSNWIKGKSKILIPMSSCREVIAASSYADFHFLVRPNATGLRRTWTILVSGTGRVRSDYDSVWHNFSASTDTAEIYPFQFSELVTAPGSTAYDASIRVETLAATTATVHAVALEEAPRYSLGLDSTDLGTDINTEVFREPMLEQANAGLYGPARVFTNPSSFYSRGLFYWATDAKTGTAFSVTGGPTNIFPMSAPIIVPKLYNGDTTGSAHVEAYVQTSASGTSGTVVATNGGTGTTYTVTVPTGSHTGFSWKNTGTTPSIDCSDMTEATGLQSGTFNSLTFSATSTAGTLYVAGIAVYFSAP